MNRIKSCSMRISIYFIICLILWLGCQKSSFKNRNIVFEIHHEIDGQNLEYDTSMYKNSVLELYSIQNLEYYISSIKLETTTNEFISIPGVFYINGKYMNVFSHSDFLLRDLQIKNVHFNIGLNQSLNVSNSLPATMENINMAWPDNIGGGYHFIKLEGTFIDSIGMSGYAIHLGRDTSLVSCIVPFNMESSQETININLLMNVNELYRNPYDYSLRKDGHSTMGDDILMHKIAKNSTDLFKIKLN